MKYYVLLDDGCGDEKMRVERKSEQEKVRQKRKIEKEKEREKRVRKGLICEGKENV